MALREYKKQKQRDDILKVCNRLFLRKGFDETSIADITKTTGISRQTFFNYFAGKDEALLALGFLWLQQHFQIPDTANLKFSKGKIVAAIRSAITSQLAAVEADRAFMRLVFTRSGALFPSTDKSSELSRQKYTRPMFERLAAIVTVAQEQGEVRADIQAMQIAEMYITQMLMTCRLWLVDYWDTNQSLVDRAEPILQILEAGITKPATRKKSLR